MIDRRDCGRYERKTRRSGYDKARRGSRGNTGRDGEVGSYRETVRERKRERQTDRQTDRQTETETLLNEFKSIILSENFFFYFIFTFLCFFSIFRLFVF